MKGIIFDLDGTMVDNMMIHHRAWQRKLKELGMDLSLPEVMQKVHGVNEEILERLFGDRFTSEERKRYSKEKEAEYRNIFKSDLKLIAGLHEFLIILKERKIPLGIGSAAPPENVDFVLDNLGIRHFFKVVLHARNVSAGKPHPEIYLKVADGLGLPVKDCLIFEDSPVGVEAARRAGSSAIVVTTTHNEDEFKDFPNVLKFITDYTKIDLNQLKTIYQGARATV
jgi:HAD superfamily hydrolase (TIGR01509 family)